MATEKATIEVEYIRNPTVKMTERRWRQVLAERIADRLAGEQGQQRDLSVNALTINGERREY